MAETNYLNTIGIQSRHEASATAPGAVVAAGTASTTILAANKSRKFFRIKNAGANVVYISLSATATASSYPLAVGEILESWTYHGIITGIVAAATENVAVIEIG